MSNPLLDSLGESLRELAPLTTWDGFWAHCVDVVRAVALAPLRPDENLFWIYLATTLLLAYGSYRYYERDTTGARATSFWRFVFPRGLYWHKSAQVDYGLFLTNVFLSPITKLFGVALQSWISIQVGNGLIQLNSGSPLVQADWTMGIYAAFVIGFVMTADLSVYIVHRVHHVSNLLWPIHSVHHSAEVLTPFTLFRKHPLWNFTANILAKLFTGVFQGLFIFAFYGKPSFEFIFGINSIQMLYNFAGSNLRHSHIWLSWGKPLSYIFISPAMHQIHHDPTRMRKNYGEMFALWDWLFGTIYIPTRKETFEFGLGTPQNPHATLRAALYVPVLDCARVVGGYFKRHTKPAPVDEG